MRIELDAYNDQGQHVMASLHLEGDVTKEQSRLVLTDLIDSIARRLPHWKEAHGNYSALVLEEGEPLPGEENEDEPEEKDIP